jgi:DNA polymerase delta, subunit 4
MDSFVRSGKPVSPSLLTRPAKTSTPHLGISSSHSSAADAVPAAAPQTATFSALSADALEDELRLFDLDATFGPFCGMTRMDRFLRAEKLGLNPPAHIRDILCMSGVVAQRDGAGLW